MRWYDVQNSLLLFFPTVKLMQQNRCFGYFLGPLFLMPFACVECGMAESIVCQFLENEKFSFILLLWMLLFLGLFPCFIVSFSLFFPCCWWWKINQTHNSSAYRYASRVSNKWVSGRVVTTVFINKNTCNFPFYTIFISLGVITFSVYYVLFLCQPFIRAVFLQWFIFIWSVFVLATMLMQMYFYTFCTCAPLYCCFVHFFSPSSLIPRHRPFSPFLRAITFRHILSTASLPSFSDSMRDGNECVHRFSKQ